MNNINIKILKYQMHMQIEFLDMELLRFEFIIVQTSFKLHI